MRIAICDDDNNCIEDCRARLTRLAQKHKIPMELDVYISGDQLLFALEDVKKPIDLIYLDINMPGNDGIRTAQKLREQRCDSEIIFLTVRKDGWREAFYVKALQYLIKDEMDDAEFEKAFLMANETISQKNKETVVFTCAGQSRNVRVEDISYFEVVDHVITVHYGNETFQFYSTLGKLEKALSSRGFMKTHQAYLVSMRHVSAIDSSGLKLLDGTTLPLSRSYKKNVQQRYESKEWD